MDLTTGIAIYAAVMSTIVGLIGAFVRLSNWQRDRTSIVINTQLSFDHNQLCIGIDVENNGRYSIDLNEIIFEMEGKIVTLSTERILQFHHNLLPCRLAVDEKLHLGASISELTKEADKYRKGITLQKVKLIGTGNKEYVSKVDGRGIKKTYDEIMLWRNRP